MTSGILFGLTAALCWGIADFCARGATRIGGTFRTLLTIQIVAITALLVVDIPTGIVRLDGLPAKAMLAAAALNLIILAGAVLLYRAFAIGTLAIVSPIAASYAAITALLALLTGEQPTLAQLGGIVLTLAGVIVVSATPEQPKLEHIQAIETNKLAGRDRRVLAPGLAEALGAMLLFGIGYWAMRYVVVQLGGVTTAFIGKASDLIVLGALALLVPLTKNRSKPSQAASRGSRRDISLFLAWVVPNALLDTGANIAYNVGITQALTSVVSVLASLFSPVTVLLAWIFLGERLTRWQWLGVIIIFAGIALVSL